MRLKCTKCEVQLRPKDKSIFILDDATKTAPIDWLCPVCGINIIIGRQGSEIAKYAYKHTALSSHNSWVAALKHVLTARGGFFET